MITAASILFLALTSGGATEVPTSAHAVMKPVDTVRSKFEAFNKHDSDAIERIYASDATLHSPDYPGLTGNKPIADTYRKLFDMIPDAKDNVERLESSSSRVYAQFVLTGHLKGTQATPISVRIISVYTVENGHIVGDETYYDRKAP
jgi:ketosteroid isomerase-like protein